MRKKRLILYAVLLIFCMQMILASNATIRSNSIASDYGPGASVTGAVSLSITNISSNAYLKTNFGQNISLTSLIRGQWNSNNYFCSTSDCNSSYSTTDSGSSSVQLSLGSGESKTVGFAVMGASPTGIEPQSFSVGISSDAPESSTPQLSIDLLDDGSTEWGSYISSGNFASKSAGCYYGPSHESDGSPVSFLSSTYYCEKISLSISPIVKIGAIINGTGFATMSLSIQDINNSYTRGTCSVQAVSGEISCVPTVNGINYSIKKDGDFFVCIKQATSGNLYQINRDNTNPCGFVGTYSSSTGYTTDFEIFGETGTFAPVGSFPLNDATVAAAGHSKNLETAISGYLSSKYGGNCQNECVIPITFNSEQSQNINLSNFQLSVDTSDLGTIPINSIYNVQKISPNINTKGWQNLSLDAANFSVPSDFGDNQLKLTLVDGSNSYNLLSKDITIERIPEIISISPTTTSGALPTDFSVNINHFGSNASITQYTLDFGDNSSIQTATANSISHTYNQIGNFNVKVSIKDSLGLSASGEFEVSVVSPRDAVPQILAEDMTKLSVIQNRIKNYSAFTGNALGKILNLDNTSAILKNLQALSINASTDNDYLGIMRQLIKINLPDDIYETSTILSAPFIPGESSINLDALKNVGGGDYDSSLTENYISSVLAWEFANVQATIDYDEISGIYKNSTMPLVHTFKLNVQGTPSGNVYVFIPALDNIQFDKAYSQSGNYYYIPLSNTAQIIQFATTESILPSNLPVFISPSLTELPVSAPAKSSGNKILVFIIVLGAAIFLGLLVYVLVGRWYKKKYENYLFKDKNDLYNIINYVHSLTSKGIKNPDIERNLRKAKWNPEQISYVMKRYAGKKVGIFGFK
ncbi:MAG TPA: PKD domain-containing protein [Candidatus Omnitrophota bacterium]|nr:PKD domain-containing protein [Candidatus Omnitrophota bacterium]